MAQVSLLVMPGDPLGMATFAFEHEMAHRTLLAGMGPLDGFSTLPYFIQPMQDTMPWRTDHQQAHDDFVATLELNSIRDLVDVDLSDPRAVTWWTFDNNMQHMAAMASLSL